MYGELGRFPMYVNLWQQIIKFISHLKYAEDNSLVKAAFDESLQMINVKNTWAYKVNEVLSKHEGTIEDCDLDVINKMKNNFTKMWSEQLNKNASKNFEGNKLRCYREFKAEFAYEKYLDIVMNPDYRKALTKLRISDHKLEIETGRYQLVPSEQRKCKQCKHGSVEDEIHFLFICNKHDQLRSSLWQSVIRSPKILTHCL